MDPQKQQDVNERMLAQYTKAQQRLGELIGSNSPKPITVSDIRVLHASHTRRGFLERIISPLLSANRDAPYTLNEALQEASLAADKLSRFGMLISLGCPDPH